jgi:GH15 family glucan-1,4-alpha-glucosidase
MAAVSNSPYRRRFDLTAGLSDGEGAFCTFRLAGNLVMMGRNDVGLLAEEYDPREKRQLGNVPRAFMHVFLINAAQPPTRSERPAKTRAKR